jgi:hypothetical protein
MSTSKKEWDELAAALARLPPEDAEPAWREEAMRALEDRDLYGLGFCLGHSPAVVAPLVAEILQGNSADWKLDLKQNRRGAPRKWATTEKRIEYARAVVEAGEDFKQEPRVNDVEKKKGVSRRTIFKELRPARDLDRAVKELQAARANANKSRN